MRYRREGSGPSHLGIGQFEHTRRRGGRGGALAQSGGDVGRHPGFESWEARFSAAFAPPLPPESNGGREKVLAQGERRVHIPSIPRRSFIPSTEDYWAPNCSVQAGEAVARRDSGLFSFQALRSKAHGKRCHLVLEDVRRWLPAALVSCGLPLLARMSAGPSGSSYARSTPCPARSGVHRRDATNAVVNLRTRFRGACRTRPVRATSCGAASYISVGTAP